MYPSKKDLRKVFSALQYGRPLQDSVMTLWSLIMDEAALPSQPLSLMNIWRFQTQFHDLMFDWLSQTCANWALPSIEADAPRQSVQDWLKMNFQAIDQRRQAILLTYALVGRFDLGFQFHELEQLTGYTRRTLERRLETGVYLFHHFLMRTCVSNPNEQSII